MTKKFACARTFCSSVLNEAIMHSLKKYLVDQLSIEPFVLVNDGWASPKRVSQRCDILVKNNVPQTSFILYIIF